MKRYFLPIVIMAIALCSCAIGKTGVFYSEMAEPPQVRLENKKLVFSTKNSSGNSALLIYKIDIKADHNKKELAVTAKQAALKKYRDSFVIELENLGVSDLSGWTVNWVDPDGKKTAIEI